MQSSPNHMLPTVCRNTFHGLLQSACSVSLHADSSRSLDICLRQPSSPCLWIHMCKLSVFFYARPACEPPVALSLHSLKYLLLIKLVTLSPCVRLLMSEVKIKVICLKTKAHSTVTSTLDPQSKLNPISMKEHILVVKLFMVCPWLFLTQCQTTLHTYFSDHVKVTYIVKLPRGRVLK